MEPSASNSHLSGISSASSVTSHEDIVEKWFEIDDSVSVDVPKQSLEEILEDTLVDFDDELDVILKEDEDPLLARGGETPSISYVLDSPLQVSQLESVSYQLKSNFERGGGKANSFAVSNTSIAIGTTRGRILIFNRIHQRLENSFFDETCPVSSLDFNRDGTKLAVGFAVGKVLIINMKAGKVVNKDNDVVQLGRGILQIVMLGRGHRMAVVDSGGSVYIYEPAVRFHSSRVKCVFSGARGEVVFVKMVADERAFALVSLTKLYIVTFPESRLIHVSPCAGPAHRPPLVDWQYLEFKFYKGNVASPVVCIARGRHISFYRLISGSNGFEKAAHLRDLTLDVDLINLKWVDSFHLLAISSEEKLLLIDIAQGLVAEDDLNKVGLVYSAAEFKGLSVGGNVSAALKYMADSVCYQSFCRLGSYSVILGQYAVYSVQLSDQISQLDAYIERDEIKSAVAYAVDLYTEKVQNKKLGLRQNISSRFPSLIEKLLMRTTGLKGGNIGRLVEHYKAHVPLLIWSCVKTSHFDLLYNTVYPILEKDMLSKAQFMETLDEVVNDGLFEDPPPAIVKDYFEYLIAESHLSQFETAVMRIPPEKQDIDFAVKECKKNKLFDGLIHLSYVALKEYTFPLEVMLEAVADFDDFEVLTDCQVEQGNKLFMYLQCCLTGHAYPTGSLPDDVVADLPVNVYRCLISRFGKNSGSETYPFIRLLLNFDGKQFLNVLFMSSDSPVFTSDSNRLYRLLGIIYEILTSMKNPILSAHFLVFLTHMIQRNGIAPPPHMIKALVDAVLLADPSGERHPGVEGCIIDLMKTRIDLDEKHILSLAKKSSHLQVCAYIYASKRQFTQLIDCYLSDDYYARDVFYQIRTLLEVLSNAELSNFKDHIRSCLVRLNGIDASWAAELVVDCFLDYLDDAESNEKNFPSLVYNCFLVRRSRGWRDLTGKPKIDEVLFSRAVEYYVENEHHSERDQDLVEIIRYWLPIGSMSDRSLNKVVKLNLPLSSATLFEARKLFQEAFAALFSELERLWKSHALKKEVSGVSLPNHNEEPCENNSDTKSGLLIEEILKLASAHRPEAAEGKWLLKVLLLVLASPEAQFDDTNSDKYHLKMIVSGIIEGGSTGIEDLVESLFGHPAFSNACYQKFRPFIETIFASCHYELNVMDMTIQCIEEENVDKMSVLVRRKTQRAADLITSVDCIVCGEPLSKSALIFSCGHVMHLECEPPNQVERKCPCRKKLFEDDSERRTLRAGSRVQVEQKHPLFAEETMKLHLGPR